MAVDGKRHRNLLKSFQRLITVDSGVEHRRAVRHEY